MQRLKSIAKDWGVEIAGACFAGKQKCLCNHGLTFEVIRVRWPS